MYTMMGKWKNRILFSFIFITSFYSSNGCWMDGVDNWNIQVGGEVVDTYSGIILNRTTRDIEDIISVTFSLSNEDPYLNVRLNDSQFIIETNDLFADYEEYETEEQISITVNFRCDGGRSAFLIFSIAIQDTNNNSPQFLPSNEFVYTIQTPSPPGIIVTGCLGGITVRDIDLTTQRIIFEIEENPYFEIVYDEAASINRPKEFIGIIRTTNFIRTLPEPITLRITATDVDLTSDPQRTESATITIIGDTEFEFPEEPVFSQAFYIANYTNDDQIDLVEPIYLRSGYDASVQFSLEGELREHFTLVENGDQITLRVVRPLEANVLRENQILLVVRAAREYTSGDSATIVVHLPEENPLAFDRPINRGTLEDKTLRSPTLLLTGYEGELLDFQIKGDYAPFFNVQQNAYYVHLTMQPEIPDIIINENTVILLEVIASTEYRSASTIVALDVLKDDALTPVFNKPLYSGTYNVDTGLTIEQLVVEQGFDSTVRLHLEGEHSDLFELRNSDEQVSSFRIITNGGIPPALFSQQQIVLTAHATKPRTVGANAAIIITLPAENPLAFDRPINRGTIEDKTLRSPTLLLTGYEGELLDFQIKGDYAPFFNVQQNAYYVHLTMQPEIPDIIINENTVILLEVIASTEYRSASTIVALDVLKDDALTPVFNKPLYSGTYNVDTGLTIEQLVVEQGFDSTVRLHLEGEHSNLFELRNSDEQVSSFRIITNGGIPPALFSQQQIVLTAHATKPRTVGANAAIIITLPAENTPVTMLSFDQVSYVGSIQSDEVTLQAIRLHPADTPGVNFSLHGGLAGFFALSPEEAGVIRIILPEAIPEQSIPVNKLIVLEIQASAPVALTARATIVFEVIVEDDLLPPIGPQLAFNATYYTGSFTNDAGLVQNSPIRLAQGYDPTVVFELEGEQAQWFSVIDDENSVTLRVSSPIPGPILASNSKLVFVISAQRSGSDTVRATIVISLHDEHIDGSILGFDQVTYQGSIEDNALTLPSITLIQGFTEDVTFSLQGDLATYFTLSPQGSGVVQVTLPNAIPDQSIPANRVIVLVIQASAPLALTAQATIVFEVIVEDDLLPPIGPQLAFNATYYTGSFTNDAGLVQNSPIRLAQGYDPTVVFELEGEQAQWFSVIDDENSVTLRVSSPIPGPILASNSKLVFVISAQRSGSDTVRATIVISLHDEHIDGAILGFDQVTYQGSIEGNALTLPSITLIQGFTEDVTFSLQGDLATYFTLSPQGSGVVQVTLPNAIPDQSIPANRVIVLVIQASAPLALTAQATIVFEVIVEDDLLPPIGPQLAFNATYYTGSFTNDAGLVQNSPIRLAQGYDPTVVFELEGEQAQWFSVIDDENSVTLRVSSPIPGPILASNSKLVFVISAQRSGSDTVRATIVISLRDEHIDGAILGFDQVTYQGSIEDNALTLPSITLIQGFTEDVTFSLQGDLATYFTLSPQGSGVVQVTLPNAIPDQSIPANRVIVLVIQASAPLALTAQATIVFEVIVEDDLLPPIGPQLAFNATYYTGSFTNDAGLVQNSPIRLAQGYDPTVVFELEGEQAQWFSVIDDENSVTLRVSSPIPGPILASNSKLVFVISAQRSGSDTVRATIVISLHDEHIDGSILGFDQVTYQGSIEDNELTLPSITIIQGFTEDVTFSLQGDLATYFTLSPQGSGVVQVILPNAIPDQSIPANRVIVLVIQASAPLALTAQATIVFEVIVEDDLLPPIGPQLAFNATYYTGSFTNDAGLVQNSPIRLAQGYDPTVVFELEGEQAQWFSVIDDENSVTLRVSSPIPGPILASNSKLVFVISAQRSGSDTVRATIVISLHDEHIDGSILGFDQVTYQGSIEDNALTLPSITLIQGFTEDVTFSLQGDLATYFTLSPQGSGVVQVTLPNAIPDQSIPANRVIVLVIQASAPLALTAQATIVFEVIVEDNLLPPIGPQLAFNATYYTGSFTNDAGLVQNSPIRLAQGYDPTVVFELEGEQAQWFSVIDDENSVTLRVSSPIPGPILASNSKLVFVISAQRSGSDTVRATIVISLHDEHIDGSILGFDQVTYQGSIEDNALTLPSITLIQGFTEDVTFSLQGDLATYFTLSPQGSGVVQVTLPNAIPDQSIPANRVIVLVIQASAPLALTAQATIVFEVIVEDDLLPPIGPQLAFNATYYTGSFTNDAGLVQNSPIRLAQGYDPTVVFELEGEQAQWFSVIDDENSVTLRVSSPIPGPILASNSKLVFVISAQRSGSDTVRATIVISLHDEHIDGSILGFDQVTYQGSIEDNALTLPSITLIQGFTEDVTFSLQGDLATYFTLSPQGSGVVQVTLPNAIPDQSIPTNRVIVLVIQASAPLALTAQATIVFEVIVEDDLLPPIGPQLAFNATYYTGSFTNDAGLVQNSPIRLAQGYDPTVVFELEGEQAQWFSVIDDENSVTLRVSSPIPGPILASNSKLVFVISAQRSGSDTVRATIVISLHDDHTDGSVLGFDQVTYQGSIEGNALTLPSITLIQGFTEDVTFSLQGDLATYFTLSPQGSGVVQVTLPNAIPDQSIPSNRVIILVIQASAPLALTAQATIVFEVIVGDDLQPPIGTQLAFDATYYTGSYTNDAGLVHNNPIRLAQGYDPTVVFELEGEHAVWFSIVSEDNSLELVVFSPIPSEVLANNLLFIFVINAQREGSATARATMVISVTDNSQTGEDVSFDKLVYEGFIQLSTVQHELIIISNYNGARVELHGDYASLFVARVADGVVTVQASGSLTLPDDVTHLALELRAVDAGAVLLLNVQQSDVPVLPSVTFGSSSYVLNVNIVQTGLVGQVEATSSNREAVTYSLGINNAHLQERISINNEGALYLSAPANSGVYRFQVIATTVITRAEGTAPVYLTVEAVTVCGDDEGIVVPPLIILDRDEEEAQTDLVILNSEQYEGCRFELTNRWPLDQNWLYVNENGLHARSIDREHESIAFMAQSQVQVELILHCASDNAVRTRRSLRTDWLGPYDYGTNKWILSESIAYNARRSLVNLIVNDINDNAPIFVGKNLEPIIVGYPIGEIEERILPRSLAELQAIDADIGENAALRYWSSEDVLAVAPTTGFVHIRSGAQLDDNQRLTVNATDRNGEGLTGTIQLTVKLLELDNIAVVTVKDAFLDDEKTILAQLTAAVGYEIKALRSVVTSDDVDQNETDASRKKRETSSAGASLLLYVYGILENEPVAVERLTADIMNNAAVASIISTVSLEDHLPVEIIFTERDIGFMVATIVLSVLLFIIIVLTAIWFFLKWRKNKSYEQFNDENSIASRPMEESPKVESPKPRLNYEDLKKSEKRLQDRLSPSMEEVTVEALSPKTEIPTESIIDLSSVVEPSSSAPIVIQSIDKLKDSEDIDDDEFGEKVQPRRKSVVTFNENVEKIIHVEDDIDTVSTSSDYEVYKL